MPVEKPPPDPSIEELLPPISRIIAEDKDPATRRPGTKAPGEAAGPAHGERSDILELTQGVDEDGSVRRVSPWAEAATALSASPDGATASRGDAAEKIEPRLSHSDAA